MYNFITDKESCYNHPFKVISLINMSCEQQNHYSDLGETGGHKEMYHEQLASCPL